MAFGLCFWTAGQRIDPPTENEFVWKVSFSNGTVVQQSLDYTNWKSGQPNSGAQACLVVTAASYNHEWNDEECDDMACSLCEIDP